MNSLLLHKGLQSYDHTVYYVCVVLGKLHTCTHVLGGEIPKYIVVKKHSSSGFYSKWFLSGQRQGSITM